MFGNCNYSSGNCVQSILEIRMDLLVQLIDNYWKIKLAHSCHQFLFASKILATSNYVLFLRIPGTLPIRSSFRLINSQTFLTDPSKSSLSTGRICHSVSFNPIFKLEIERMEGRSFFKLL